MGRNHAVAALARASDSAAVRPARRTYRYYVLFVLALIALLNTVDQAILVVTSPAIQMEFGLTDSQVGFLSSAFVVVYGLAALPSAFGWIGSGDV